VLRPDDRHPFVGGTGGIRAAFFVYPKDQFAVIVLTNAQGARPESLVEGVARKLLGNRIAGTESSARPTGLPVSDSEAVRSDFRMRRQQ
jgi:hypothetical protein